MERIRENKTKALVVVLLLAAMALLLSACGANRKESETAGESSSASGSSEIIETSSPAETSESASEPENPENPENPDSRVDALKYSMILHLDTEAERLSQLVTMTIQNNTKDSVREIVIRNMAPGALAYAKQNYGDEENDTLTSIVNVVYRGTAPKEAVPGSGATGQALEYRLAEDETVIIVQLDEPLAPGEESAVTIDMATDIPKRQDRFAVQENEMGKHFALSFCFPYLADNRSVNATAFMAEGAVRKTLIDNIAWDTAPFFDDGESRSTDLADYEVTMVVPDTYTIVAVGRISEEAGGQAKASGEKIFSITAYGMRDFAIVASDYMEKESFVAEGVTVNNYYLRGGNDTEAYNTLVPIITEDSLRLFQEKLGPYPYKELDIVECLFGFAFGGMEYPELVMVNGTDFFDGMGAEMGAQGLVQALSHEIAHQWFYASLGNDEYREGWLDEGFTSYMEREVFGLADSKTNMVLRAMDPSVLSFEEIKADRSEYMTFFKEQWPYLYLNLAPEEYEGEREYAEGEYEGGFLFLLELREIWGEANFDDFLKAYYEAYAGQIATTKDVVALIRRMDTDQKAEPLLQYYIRE